MSTQQHSNQPIINNPMSTPLNNIPLKSNQQMDQTELQDPLVQDVLKEFEEEVAAAKIHTNNNIPLRPQNPNQQYQQQSPNPNQQYQQQLPIHNQQYPVYNIQPNNDKKIIDYDYIKKSLIIGIISIFVFYPCFKFIYSKFSENISNYLQTYDILIKGFILFIIIYILMYYNVIE